MRYLYKLYFDRLNLTRYFENKMCIDMYLAIDRMYKFMPTHGQKNVQMFRNLDLVLTSTLV